MSMTHSDIIHDGPRLPRYSGCPRYTGCAMCGKALSIAEVIERHCENCGRPTSPKEMREILPGALLITHPDGVTPP
ncbi:hypothetical protein GGE16_000844 [Rhizobium leguminosarum]|uniref:Uncharacterized protein n=1 Tax=Rhizobium leguminosarum TaxID=384 RepID=A0AAE2MG57_RHILE|nr:MULTISPECIES: hypothetical protein [Rhizobium]MBB4288828.1 hypothetical protein [Rhizobium leguminosarum]MBB4295078.1 hypothetical protein [Rhizobium leguminosarum]MBB4306472.1 hypothetical protein [Rhizobium leguminosarum]MBB4417948.1 hypothetical protein [Rhizobium leguminosarum]MBB4432793.1 hypothetical protein [Rhizobium esperanzae]